MAEVFIPFRNPKTRILYCVAKRHGNGTILELSREAGINDDEKTETYVAELITEKLLKKGNPKKDPTLVKLTERGQWMISGFLSDSPYWSWKFQLVSGAVWLLFGMFDLVEYPGSSSVRADLSLLFLVVLPFLLGALSLTNALRIRRYRNKLLEREKIASMSDSPKFDYNFH